MITKSRIAGALAALTFATSLTLPTGPAEAHGRGFGIGAAIVGSALVGAAIASSAAPAPYYVDGYRRCRFERQYDADGAYAGTVRVCRIY